MVGFSVIIYIMQKKTNYFLFIVQGRGLNQRVELDKLGVVPRSVTLPVMGHTSDRKNLVDGVLEMVSSRCLVGKSIVPPISHINNNVD